jgi:hypothetical protein
VASARLRTSSAFKLLNYQTSVRFRQLFDNQVLADISTYFISINREAYEIFARLRIYLHYVQLLFKHVQYFRHQQSCEQESSSSYR